MGAMKTTASRETLASDQSDPAAAAAAAAVTGAANGAVNGRSVSPAGTPYQLRRHPDVRDHSPSPCRCSSDPVLFLYLLGCNGIARI